MNNVSDYFGSMVFDDFTMKEKLPKATYKEYHQCLYDNKSLSIVAYSLSNYPVRNSRFMEPAAGDMLVISLTILFFAIIAVSCWRHIFCK